MHCAYIWCCSFSLVVCGSSSQVDPSFKNRSKVTFWRSRFCIFISVFLLLFFGSRYSVTHTYRTGKIWRWYVLCVRDVNIFEKIYIYIYAYNVYCLHCYTRNTHDTKLSSRNTTQQLFLCEFSVLDCKNGGMYAHIDIHYTYFFFIPSTDIVIKLPNFNVSAQRTSATNRDMCTFGSKQFPF